MKVLFFGVLSEVVLCNEMTLSNINSLASLKTQLEKKYPKLKKYHYIIAVNETIVTAPFVLNDGDEVALLPPYSGG